MWDNYPDKMDKLGFQTWEVWDSASTTGNEDWNKEAQLWPLILHNLEK